MKIEIEVKSPDAKNEIYELRNFLQEQNIEGLRLELKEQPPQDGEMNLGEVFGLVADLLPGVNDPIVKETGNAILGFAVDRIFGYTLEKPIKKWLEKRKKEGKKDIEVITSIKDEKTAQHYIADSSGNVSTLDDQFAIDVNRTKVVLIGNSEFDHSFLSIPPVKGNVEDFYNLLIDKKIIGIPPENITVLFNKTDSEIEENLLVASRTKNLETFMVYYAGHGYRSDLNKLYLVAKNTKKIDTHILAGIDLDFVKNVVLNQSTALQKIVILDACHSGVAAQGDVDPTRNFNVKGSYILTSSPCDEVSYFHKEGRNTFFTGELIDFLKNGLDDDREQISLDNLYENTRANLKAKNFPEPRYKNELSIPASNFFIARNPKFSLEKLKQKPKKLFKQGRFEEALQEYQMLLQRFPSDTTLNADYENCKTEVNFLKYVQEGDELFHNEKQYEKALEKYNLALSIKDDYSVNAKINKCKDYIKIRKEIGSPETRGGSTDASEISIKTNKSYSRQDSNTNNTQENREEKTAARSFNINRQQRLTPFWKSRRTILMVLVGLIAVISIVYTLNADKGSFKKSANEKPVNLDSSLGETDSVNKLSLPELTRVLNTKVYYAGSDTLNQGSIFEIENGKSSLYFKSSTGNQIHSFAFGPDGNLYFLNANRYSVYKVKNKEETQVYEHTTYVRDLAFDSKGRLYFSESSGATSDGFIYRLEGAKARLFYRVKLSTIDGDWAGGFAFDGNDKLWLSNGNRIPAQLYYINDLEETPRRWHKVELSTFDGFCFDKNGNIIFASGWEGIYSLMYPTFERSKSFQHPSRLYLTDVVSTSLIK